MQVTVWEHGTIVRASRHRSFYFHKAVRVEDEPKLSAEELIAFADSALGETCRMIVFDRVAAAERLRARMEALGWRRCRLVLMLHVLALPGAHGSEWEVVDVDYDEVHALRARWHLEDFPASDPEDYLAAKREIDRDGDYSVLASLRDGCALGLAELVWAGDSAEIDGVNVVPEHRGRGLGTALTRAAVERGAGARQLWIGADEEDRPKQLYERLGFRAAWTGVEFLQMPSAPARTIYERPSWSTRSLADGIRESGGTLRGLLRWTKNDRIDQRGTRRDLDWNAALGRACAGATTASYGVGCQTGEVGPSEFT